MTDKAVARPNAKPDTTFAGRAPDCVLIQHGRAHQIWRGKSKGLLPPLHPDLVAQIVEAESNTVAEGDAWTGAAFEKPAAPDPKHVALAELKASDAAMARIAEDLIDALTAKGVIAESDLPDGARASRNAQGAARRVERTFNHA